MLTLVSLLITSYSEGLRFGPQLPARTVVSLILFLAVVLHALSQKTPLITLRVGKVLLLLWLVLIVWILIAKVINGSDPYRVFRQLVGRHFTAFAAMLGIIACARGRNRLFWMVVAIAGTVFISAFVAIMQWLDQGWAWQLRLWLNVPLEAGDVDLVDFMPEVTLVSGLYGAAFQASYYMMVGAVLFLPLMLYPRWRYIVCVPFFVTLVAAVIIQERSAVLAVLLCSAAFFFQLMRNARGRTLNILVIVGILCIGGYVAFRWVVRQSADTARYSITRYSQYSSERRVIAFQNAWVLCRQNIFAGTPPEEYSDKSDARAAVTPHNLFFNALLYYGLPGLAITLAIATAQTWLGWTVWRLAWKQKDYAAVGCFMAMAAYLFNCQFHNASILNGDYLGWWVVGLLIACRQNLEAESAVRPARPAVAISPKQTCAGY